MSDILFPLCSASGIDVVSDMAACCVICRQGILLELDILLLAQTTGGQWVESGSHL
jgi:hypothetical protein